MYWTTDLAREVSRLIAWIDISWAFPVLILSYGWLHVSRRSYLPCENGSCDAKIPRHALMLANAILLIPRKYLTTTKWLSGNRINALRVLALRLQSHSSAIISRTVYTWYLGRCLREVDQPVAISHYFLVSVETDAPPRPWPSPRLRAKPEKGSPDETIEKNLKASISQKVADRFLVVTKLCAVRKWVTTTTGRSPRPLETGQRPCIAPESVWGWRIGLMR